MTTEFIYHPQILQEELTKIANVLVQPGRIIIDASEFKEPTETSLITNIEQDNDISQLIVEPRRSVKEILFSTPSLSNYVSGVIINEATVNDLTIDGLSFINLFRRSRIVPGIKLNKNIIKLDDSIISEYTTEGLDDLAVRCKQYKNDGFHFAQWCSMLEVSSLIPTSQAIQENANLLARFVSICQAYRIVPIVYTNIVQNGIHDIIRSQKVTETFLAMVFKAFNDHHVFLQGLILKTNFITQGIFSENECSIEDIMYSTITALRRTVPVSIAGIIFPTNYYSSNNTFIYANEIIKYITDKCDNLYTITFITDKLNHYSIPQSITDEEEIRNIQEIQQELIKEMCALSNVSLGIFIQENQKSFDISL